MSLSSLMYEVAGLGQAPDPDYALRYGRILAKRSGYTVPDHAEATIRQAVDDSDQYRVEIPIQQ